MPKLSPRDIMAGVWRAPAVRSGECVRCGKPTVDEEHRYGGDAVRCALRDADAYDHWRHTGDAASAAALDRADRAIRHIPEGET